MIYGVQTVQEDVKNIASFSNKIPNFLKEWVLCWHLTHLWKKCSLYLACAIIAYA